MILVTGAAGKTGRAVLQALAARGARVRAFARRPEQAASVLAVGAGEVVHGDLRDRRAMDLAMAGVQRVYHICPNVSPDEQHIGGVALAAAKHAGVQHFVYHSVLHPQTESMPHHWLKLRVEESLFASGLAFTILQPAVYMQNVLAQRGSLLEQGRYPIPYPAETRLSLVDLADVAEVAARVLTEPGHEGATYELAGTGPLSQIDVAAAVGAHLGRRVAVSEVSLNDWRRQAAAAGLGAYQVDALTNMFAYYRAHGLVGNPTVLSWLLGRSPTSFGAFLARELAPASEHAAPTTLCI